MPPDLRSRGHKKSISPTESLNHALTRDGTWQRVILLDDGRCSKNIDCAEFMRVRFTIDSDWSRMSVQIYGVLNTNTNIHLTWIVLKPNVMQTMYLMNIQYIYNIIIIDFTRGLHGKLSPLENQYQPRLHLGGRWFYCYLISDLENMFASTLGRNF